MSVHEQLLDYVVSAVRGLSLDGIETAAVKKRGLPTAREELDTVPCCLVCPPQRGETTQRDSTEGTHGVEYPVQVVLVSAVNADLSVPSTVLDNRQAVRERFEDTVGVPHLGVWDTEVDPDPPLDRRRLSQHYAYSPMMLLFKSHEG